MFPEWFLLLFPVLSSIVFWQRGGHGLATLTGSQIWKLVYGFVLAFPIIALGFPWWLYLICGILCFGTVTIGHGTGQDFGTGQPRNFDEDETISVFIRKLGIHYDTTLHDALLMFISGALYGLPMVLIALFTTVPLFPMAVLMLFLGITKMVSYMLANAIIRKTSPIWLAELICGFTQGSQIASVVWALTLP